MMRRLRLSPVRSLQFCDVSDHDYDGLDELDKALDELEKTDHVVGRAGNSYRRMLAQLRGPNYGLTSEEIKGIYGDHDDNSKEAQGGADSSTSEEGPGAEGGPQDCER